MLIYFFFFLLSTTNESSQYHLAQGPPPPLLPTGKLVSSSSPPLVNNPLSPSTMNSQPVSHTITPAITVNNIQQTPSPSSTPVAYATTLNSNSSGLGTATNTNVLTTNITNIINAGRQQQYHRPLLRNADENLNVGTVNSYDGKENKRKPFATISF